MITFNLSSSKFYNKVSNIAKIISSKNSLPVLDDILFQVSDNSVKMTAADMESQVTTSLPTIADGTAVFGMDAHLLLNSLKELPEQPLTITVDMDSSKCRIKYMNGNFDMSIRKDEEFPLRPEIKENNVCSINVETFHRIISKAIGFVEFDDIRPVLGGISFNFGENLEICATGGCQLVKITTKYTGESKGSFILSHKACKLTDMFAGKQNEDVKICFDNINVSFELEGYSYICRLIDGHYPNYNSVIPKNYQDNVIVDRADLTSSLKRVMVFTNTQSCLVRFNVNGSEIKVNGMDVDFSCSAEESLNCTCNGKDIIAGLKGSFMVNILNSLGGENVKITYFSNGAAFLFEPENTEQDFEILCLLMPMMLND